MAVRQQLHTLTIPTPRAPAIVEEVAASPHVVLRRRKVRFLLIGVALSDIVLILLACVLGWELRTTLREEWFFETPQKVSLLSWQPMIFVTLWTAVLLQRRIWRPRHLATGLEEFRGIAHASAVALGVVVFVDFLIAMQFARGWVLLTFAIGTPLLMLNHYALRRFVHHVRRAGRLRHRVLVVSSPEALTEVQAMLASRPTLGCDVIGVCVPAAAVATLDPDLAPEALLPGTDVPFLGDTTGLRAAALGVDADTVLVIGDGLTRPSDVRQMTWDLHGSAANLIVAPSLVDVAAPRVQMTVVDGLPLVHVGEPQAGRAGGRRKRLFDVVASAVLLVLVSPVLLAAMAAVKLTDRGPILFRQQRIGRNGASMSCLKLRTMVVGAEALEAQLRDEAEHDGALFKLAEDPRVTRVGRMLRRFSIDELPQLWNVLRGDMSLVGPRPQQSWEVETYDDATRRRLLVRPGITGLWQVSGRSNLPWHEAVRLDLYYVDNWSMVGDLLIVFRTVKAVFAREGAY